MTVLKVPNDTAYLPVLQSFVLSSAELAKIDKFFFPKLQLVCEEAFVYILKNSFEDGESDFVTVKTTVENSRFILSFFDTGLPFDESLSRGYSLNDFSAEGLELFLIKQYADRVEWINHGNEGKEFRLSFDMSGEDIFTIDRNKKEQKPDKENLNPEDIEIRLFEKNDAIKISRIIYRAYGYTYPNVDMYYPQKISDLNKNGELISIVAVNKKNGEMLGHYALERPGLGNIAESGQAVVSPKCRGMGLMKNMRNLLEQRAKELKLEGIMSQPVTSHIFSQRVNEGFGSTACGFSYGLVPSKLSFKQLNQTLSQRESCFLYFKVLKQRNRELYIPEKHAEIIETIYTDLNIGYKKKNSCGNTKSEVTYTYSPNWGIGTINVYKIANETFSEIKKALYNLLFSMKAEVIFLNITLEDGEISGLVEKTEKEKFFFAGICPSLLKGKDAVRFEFLNGMIDESKIQVYSEHAGKIFEYISAQRKEVLN
jgi:anti-sigma regulatory factor (Ser/Thr protein kinase)